MISSEQSKEIKNQIIQQIESTFPEDKKVAAISQIELMDSKQLEEFLDKNNLIKTGQNPSGEQCIFCLILSGKVNSYKVDENENVLAILEINPVSKGHTIIIPKKHQDKSSKRTLSFAEKISKKIQSKLKPKKILTSSGNLFGHEIINIIPVYNDENANSERYRAKKEELEEMQKILTQTKKVVVKKPKIKKISESLWLPKRIP